MEKKFPKLSSDEAAETFVDEADLSQYDLSDMKPVSFEFQPKDKSITIRLPEPLFDAIKKEAERSGVPYQRFIRQTLENALHLGK